MLLNSYRKAFYLACRLLECFVSVFLLSHFTVSTTHVSTDRRFCWVFVEVFCEILCHLIDAKFAVITAVRLFCDVTLCHWASRFRRFGGIYPLLGLLDPKGTASLLSETPRSHVKCRGRDGRLQNTHHQILMLSKRYGWNLSSSVMLLFGTACSLINCLEIT
jgi:hypothetical protein